MAALKLATLEDTLKLGLLLAQFLPASGVRVILLRGCLGSGKTTLASALARNLPGSEQAEIASPSFTLCNIYPTTPPVVHCDLYRSPGEIPEELNDALDDGRSIVVVEWADTLDARLLPDDFLDISLQIHDNTRLLFLNNNGPKAQALAAQVFSAMTGETTGPSLTNSVAASRR